MLKRIKVSLWSSAKIQSVLKSLIDRFSFTRQCKMVKLVKCSVCGAFILVFYLDPKETGMNYVSCPNCKNKEMKFLPKLSQGGTKVP